MRASGGERELFLASAIEESMWASASLFAILSIHILNESSKIFFDAMKLRYYHRVRRVCVVFSQIFSQIAAYAPIVLMSRFLCACGGEKGSRGRLMYKTIVGKPEHGFETFVGLSQVVQ